LYHHSENNYKNQFIRFYIFYNQIIMYNETIQNNLIVSIYNGITTYFVEIFFNGKNVLSYIYNFRKCLNLFHIIKNDFIIEKYHDANPICIEKMDSYVEYNVYVTINNIGYNNSLLFDRTLLGMDP